MRTTHNVQTGAYRLHNAPKDVYTKMSYDRSDTALATASLPYRSAFEAYLDDMGLALAVASAAWEAKIDDLVASGLSEEDAIAQLIEESLAGPASHPIVAWAVRKHWLACDALNRTSESGRWVPPETLAIKWVHDAGHTEVLQLLSALPYWPVGLDEAGDWC
jgi:hypothetical protein